MSPLVWAASADFSRVLLPLIAVSAVVCLPRPGQGPLRAVGAA